MEFGVVKPYVPPPPPPPLPTYVLEARAILEDRETTITESLVAWRTEIVTILLACATLLMFLAIVRLRKYETAETPSIVVTAPVDRRTLRHAALRTRGVREK